MQLSQFDFKLDKSRIATRPLARRGDAKLMVAPESEDAAIQHETFASLLTHLKPEDLLVFNDTRVIRTRLKGRKRSGGSVHVTLTESVDASHAWAYVQANHMPALGESILLLDSEKRLCGGEAQLVACDEPSGRYLLAFSSIDGRGPFDWAADHGCLMLPPYMGREAEATDEQRYQTLFARHEGALAAPTAGLHFDEDFFDVLKREKRAYAFVTLHVGLGTFLPVRSEKIQDHRMHREWFHVPEETVAAVEACRRGGGKVVAIGTTTLRALESAWDRASGRLLAQHQETDLFIQPGYTFQVVDRLLTNFHLPKSTLMILVSAFSGLKRIRTLYSSALDQDYRFLSYGDAMLLRRSSLEAL